MPVAVVAIGGNSLIKDETRPSVAGEIEALQETCLHIGGMLAAGWDVVMTHGNGPHVGFNLLRSEIAAHVTPPLPLDVLGAQTQGSIGYLIQQILGSELRRRGIRKRVVTVVTQTIVDPDDPAFHRPTKPIGNFYGRVEAERLQRDRGWQMVEDAGRGWRRVVDKDLASSLLARAIGADLLLISTAVERVALNYGRPDHHDLSAMTVSEAKRYLSQGHFPPGSMGPKILAAIRFIEAGGAEALITSPQSIDRALAGQAGTRITGG